jgi:exodeoxyribonuclease V alpha subunit
MTLHYTMLQRNLLYTGIPVLPEKKAVVIAVRSVSGRRRWSKLCEWLRSAAAGR